MRTVGAARARILVALGAVRDSLTPLELRMLRILKRCEAVEMLDSGSDLASKDIKRLWLLLRFKCTAWAPRKLSISDGPGSG